MHFESHDPTNEEIESEFWRIVEIGEEENGCCVEALYASDLDSLKQGSQFLKRKDAKEQEAILKHPWNIHKWSRGSDSMLKFIKDKEDITGN